MDRTQELPVQKPLAEVYARYLPELIIEKILRAGGAEAGATAEQFRCAVMFADISGFTPLTEKLAASGEDGTERLTAALNDYFSPLIELVRDHGGDVVKFAGDALIALWREREGADDLGTASWRACQCGLSIQRELSDHAIEGLPLTLRVAIGAGTVTIAHVGGQLDRWEFIISGRPLEQVGQVSERIQPGDVGLSPEISEHLRDCPDCQPTFHPGPGDCFILESMTALPERCEFRASVIRAEHQKALRNYLPGAIVHRLGEGLDDYLGELRLLTILFVNLPDIDYHTTIDDAQAIMEQLQAACYRFEGSINKLSVDDKGVSLLAAFGLPPLFHPDDPERGIRAALAIHQALAAVDLRCSIGVTTGRVYCGAVGSDFRREYTIMGDPVNVAARLMKAAGDGILCDRATRSRCSGSFHFDAPRELILKGKAEPVTAFQPIEFRRPETRSRDAVTLVGRDAQRDRIEQRLQALENRNSGVLVIEAEAGMGKTLLLEHVARRARESGMAVYSAAADAVEKSTSYFIWQQIVREALDIGDQKEPEAARRQALESLEAAGHRNFAPLLNDVLNIGFEDSELTRQMAGGVRGSNIRKVITDLLRRETDDRPLVILIDDAHWMDSASWATLLESAREVRPLLLVVAMRPLRSPIHENDELRERADSEVVELGPMPIEDLCALVADRLGIETLPEPVVELVQERAEGHPYVAEEIGQALRDAGALEVESGRARLSMEVLASLDLPDTIQGMITARIDRLTPSQAMTLKVASIIGRVFRLDALVGVYPQLRTARALLEDLEALAALEVSRSDEPDEHRSYVFRHLIVQKVAYRLMLGDQRRQLHAKVAQWLEANLEDPANHYPLLAHHWRRAEVFDRALDYLERAAERALEVFANEEAVGFLEDALEIAERHPVEPLRKGTWLRRLATAQRDLTQLDDALETVDRAVRTLGAPPPRSRLGYLAGVIWQAGLQWMYSKWPHRRVQRDKAQRLRLTEAAEAYDVAMIIHYWRADKARLFYSVLRTANLATESGRTPRVLIRAYSNLGVVTGVVPLPRAAEYYCHKAEILAAGRRHQPTQAWVGLPIATYRTGRGEFERAEAGYDEALEISIRIGDERHWSSLTASKMLLLFVQGRIYESLINYRVLLRSGEKRDDRQAIIWGLTGQARIHCRQGQWGKMHKFIDQCEPWLSHCTLVNQIDVYALSGLAHLMAGDDQPAIDDLLKLESMLQRPSQVTLYPACAQVGLAVIEACRRHPGDVRLARLRKRTLRFAGQYARVFPIGEPIHRVLKGLEQWLAGNRPGAAAELIEGREAGERLGMPFEVALACEALLHLDLATDVSAVERQRDRALEQMQIEAVGWPIQTG